MKRFLLPVMMKDIHSGSGGGLAFPPTKNEQAGAAEFSMNIHPELSAPYLFRRPASHPFRIRRTSR
jgi:hypothetical protein